MNVQDITFGVEIECFVPAGTITPGAYHVGLPIPNFPTGWNAQHDGSLRTRRGSGRVGVEIVSPVLKGVDGLRQIKIVLEKLRELNATVTPKCGFHVHVGFGNNPDNLKKLLHLVSNFEQAFYAATGTKARERGHYCRPIRQAFRGIDLTATSGRMPALNRYHLLNVSNLLGGSKPTVEFRAFAGTLNFEKIVSYVRMCVGVVERSLKMQRPAKWESARPVESSPIHRSGEGQTELTRLFYQLGWVKGRQPHTHGDLTAEGLPSIGRSKRVLIRLARQYDARP